jgi:hypothetical protein
MKHKPTSTCKFLQSVSFNTPKSTTSLNFPIFIHLKELRKKQLFYNIHLLLK